MVIGKKKEILILKQKDISPDSSNIILKTSDLSIGYRKKNERSVVASEINIDVKEGELVAVIGVNGVGKSTFLRTLSGVQPELDGSIYLNGKLRKEIPERDLAALVSLVLTGQPFSRNLSIQELVTLGRQPYTNWIGTVTQKDQEKVRTALQLVNIEDLQQRKCFELSDGQLQKVLIARALAQDTPVMILDEPTSHLDLYHKAQVLKLLKDLTAHTRKSIVFATHEINLALQLCDQIILMKPEEVRQGNPEVLIRDHAFEGVFPSDLIIFDKETRSFRIKT